MCASLRYWIHGSHPPPSPPPAPWSYFHNTISRIVLVIPFMHIYFWSSLCTDPPPHRLLLVIPVRFKGTVKRSKKRKTCFATLPQNELNSILPPTNQSLSTTSSPGLFPYKVGGAGKGPGIGWSRFFIKYSYDGMTAFQKNTLVYWFVINFSGRWRKSPRETRHSGCVERAKFWKLTGIFGGINS